MKFQEIWKIFAKLCRLNAMQRDANEAKPKNSYFHYAISQVSVKYSFHTLRRDNRFTRFSRVLYGTKATNTIELILSSNQNYTLEIQRKFQ